MKLKLLRNVVWVLVGVMGVASIKPALAADAPAAKPAAASVPEIPKKLSLLDMNKELITLDDYAAILQKAGYITKISTETSGKRVLVVNWEDKTGKYGVNLTQDKKGENESLNFVAPLSSLANQPRVPAEVFFKLVEAQDATRGWYFVFNPQLKRLFLCRTTSDAKITSRELLFELGNLEFSAQLTARLWNPAMWITKAPSAPAASDNKAPAPAKK
jgi:hypothetical protein